MVETLRLWKERIPFSEEVDQPLLFVVLWMMFEKRAVVELGVVQEVCYCSRQIEMVGPEGWWRGFVNTNVVVAIVVAVKEVLPFCWSVG